MTIIKGRTYRSDDASAEVILTSISNQYPVVAICTKPNGNQEIRTFTSDGYFVIGSPDHPFNLTEIETRKTVWVAFTKDPVAPTGYIATRTLDSREEFDDFPTDGYVSIQPFTIVEGSGL